MDHVLSKFCRVNELLQTQRPLVCDVYEIMKKLYLTFLTAYVYCDDEECMGINPQEKDRLKPLDMVDMGTQAAEHLTRNADLIDDEMRRNFLQNCVNF